MGKIIKHPTVEIYLTEEEARIAVASVRDSWTPDRLGHEMGNVPLCLIRKLEATLKEFERKRVERQEFLDSITDDEVELIRDWLEDRRRSR